MAGIYIHIPFCKQACFYCDFHFSTNQQVRTDLVAAICKEIYLQKNYLDGEPLQTIYIGGGTPSLLQQHELAQIFEAVRSTHRMEPLPEITLEANPDDLTLLKLKELHELGINRLSIGIQSFHQEFLSFLNRAHDASAAQTSFYLAREAGFDNISIDLMYAIPGETELQWRADIQQAVDLLPEHISCYSLTIEEKTVFGRWHTSGKLKASTDETAAAQLETLMKVLEQHGYEHYEISNFARPGFQSKHNSNYWKQKKYLGVGPSAHSYDGNSRQYNIHNNHLYLKALEQERIPFQKETLSLENKVNEYILTTLRTHWGTDLKKIKQDFGHDLLQQNAAYLSTIFENKLATLNEGILRLTKKGKLLADKISSDLFMTP
ncbi:MAG: radical SAM family heme chaperone HemW [Cyclobacteriaceae bacterium]